eukprot:TRINITY_DN31953_c0_g1_i1.p1 TRINITY_DN31953_c0_g1~~TRINITY_DN31953_c0_g1_i1.p1  ORF type:complete len:432 (+),score=62.23 TRINITY_DN31953_c0_g1_i1:105-1400(+)
MGKGSRTKRLQFPLVMLFLVVCSGVMFIMYAGHLTSLEGSKEPDRFVQPVLLETAKPPPPPPNPEKVAFDELYKKAKRTVGRSSKRLIYDPEPTPDPRGLPLTRHTSPATTKPDGSIWTPDRKDKRQPPLIPAVPITEEKQKWKDEEAQEWELVVGIPSIDTEKGARRRSYQRKSWMRYPNVGKTVLVKYLLAYHPSVNYTVSKGLRDEAAEHGDIIFFDMKEGVWKEGKKPWAVEVGMSRKAYAWYCYAADTYKTRYVMKGDDDEYIRTMLLENELKAIPYQSRVYYGRIMTWGIKKGSKLAFPFSGGMSITMSFDLVDWIRDSLLAEDNADYYHEDVMVGRWFYYANLPVNVVRDCRHHDIHSGANKQRLTDASLCIHHLKDTLSEYTDLFSRFSDTGLPPSKRWAPSTNRDHFGNTFLDIGGSCSKSR